MFCLIYIKGFVSKHTCILGIGKPLYYIMLMDNQCWFPNLTGSFYYRTLTVYDGVYHITHVVLINALVTILTISFVFGLFLCLLSLFLLLPIYTLIKRRPYDNFVNNDILWLHVHVHTIQAFQYCSFIFLS